MTRLLFSSMRNEGPAVLEWIAYHLSIGFDQIMIATNDCDDGSDDLIKSIASVAAVSHLENSDLGGDSPQKRAYAKMIATDAFADASYLMILDADEFLNIHDGNGQLDDLINTMDKHDVMGINWACFGPDAERGWRDEWVTQRFSSRLVPKWGLYVVGNCKALTRDPKRFKQFFNHSPGAKSDKSDIKFLRDYDETEIIASDGKAKQNMRMNFAYKVEYRHAQINHYVTKSMPEYRLRIQRGRGHVASRENDRHTIEYFMQFVDQHQMVSDTSIHRHLPNARQVAEQLLSHASVQNAFSECLKRFRAKIENASKDWDADSFRI